MSAVLCVNPFVLAALAPAPVTLSAAYTGNSGGVPGGDTMLHSVDVGVGSPSDLVLVGVMFEGDGVEAAIRVGGVAATKLISVSRDVENTPGRIHVTAAIYAATGVGNGVQTVEQTNTQGPFAINRGAVSAARLSGYSATPRDTVAFTIANAATQGSGTIDVADDGFVLGVLTEGDGGVAGAVGLDRDHAGDIIEGAHSGQATASKTLPAQSLQVGFNNILVNQPAAAVFASMEPA
ncbi:MAG: hypothetical protein AAFR16_08980 [Pseudomonadota bacterium]